jgi:hypothetical protein
MSYPPGTPDPSSGDPGRDQDPDDRPEDARTDGPAGRGQDADLWAPAEQQRPDPDQPPYSPQPPYSQQPTQSGHPPYSQPSHPAQSGPWPAQPPYPPPGYGDPYGRQSHAQHPGQPPYGQQPYGYGYGHAGQGFARPRNTKAVAALWTGIGALVLTLCCGAGVLGVVPIVLGVKARSEIRAGGGQEDGDGMAVAGIVTGAVAVVLSIAFIAVIVIALATNGAAGGTFGETRV